MRKIKLYLSSVVIYGLGIIIFRYFSYYQNVLSQQTQSTLLYLYVLYLLIAPFYHWIFSSKYSENKPYLFLQWLVNIFTKRKFSFEKKQKVAFLFMIVKLFFLPLMINFFYSNYNSLINYQSLPLYPLIFTIIFTIDTLVFSFGYAFEFRALKNVVRSVEPTFFGWFVAIICYPPFNSFVGKYVPWGANDYVLFWNPTWTAIIRILIVMLLIIYVWATIALGTKASNLTNRGIVSKFPYSIIRHPAYISKNLIWWLTLIPVISWPFVLGMFFWTVIYFFRAITEERHLLQDPDYVKYSTKVKWRFIPYVY